MSEFELLAQDLLEKAEAEEQLRQENDKKLLGQVLEIYDQKYVAELLRKVGKNEWSRETLNRWINGKCSPKTLTLAEEELLRKMLPEAPAHHPDYAFRFIDLFAGIEVYGRASKPSVASAFLPVNGIKRLCAHIKLTGLTMLRNTLSISIFVKSRSVINLKYLKTMPMLTLMSMCRIMMYF